MSNDILRPPFFSFKTLFLVFIRHDSSRKYPFPLNLSFPCFHHVVNYLPSFHWYYKFSVENMSDYNEGLIKEINTASVV